MCREWVGERKTTLDPNLMHYFPLMIIEAKSAPSTIGKFIGSRAPLYSIGVLLSLIERGKAAGNVVHCARQHRNVRGGESISSQPGFGAAGNNDLQFVIASELMKSRSLAPDGAMHASQVVFFLALECRSRAAAETPRWLLRVCCLIKTDV